MTNSLVLAHDQVPTLSEERESFDFWTDEGRGAYGIFWFPWREGT